MDERAFFARIEGRVQGVGFRYWCVREARRLGVTGWVRNTPAGDVELWAEGTEAALEELARWLHNGPPGARVDFVSREERAPHGYRDFNVER